MQNLKTHGRTRHDQVKEHSVWQGGEVHLEKQTQQTVRSQEV